MPNSSSGMTDDQVELMVGSVEDGAFLDRPGGCLVTLVRCVDCERMYEEELEAAKAKIVGRADLLCLSCDPDADVPFFMGVLLQLWRN